MKRFLPILLLVSCTLMVYAKPTTESLNRTLSFTENKGQVVGANGEPHPEILYHLSGNGVNVSLTSQGIHYTYIVPINTVSETPATTLSAFAGKQLLIKYQTVALDVTLLNSNPEATIKAEEQQENYVNYYTTASRRAGGIVNLHGYARIVYHDIYPNIDWIIYVPKEAPAGRVKYDFVVRPGGNPNDIQMQYDGAKNLAILPDGSFQATTELGKLQEAKPVSYLRPDNKEVKSAYTLKNNILAFSMSAPPNVSFVIDPQVVWSTYYGGYGVGNGQDYGEAVATDTAGNAYVGGYTQSGINIATPGSYKPNISTGVCDAFLAKFAPTGNLLWATYYGGSDKDIAKAVTTDNLGSVYLCGYTQSIDSIATAGSHQATHGSINPATNGDAFIAKFNLAGNLIWATYYGGSFSDCINTAACDTLGNLYVGGVGSANGIATPGSYQSTTVSTSGNGFFAKFNASGVRQWGSYFHGNVTDYVNGITADKFGNVYICGLATSTTGVATTGSFQSTKGSNDSTDAFIAKFNAGGSINWASYFGGQGNETSNGLICDGAGNVYLSGVTTSVTGIASSGSHQSAFGGGYTDGFLVKFNSSGARQWATYYGGTGDERSINSFLLNQGTGFSFKSTSVDICFAHNRLWLGGSTNSTNGIATPNSYQDTLVPPPASETNAFIASFDTSGKRFWGSYLGGASGTWGTAVSGNSSGDVYFTGITDCTSGIASANAYQLNLASSTSPQDAFLLHIADSLSAIRLLDIPHLCENDAFNVRYVIPGNGVLRLGNVFTAQLSNAAGSFSAPTVVGTLTSSVGGSIPCVLPAGVKGPGYKLRVASSNQPMISDTAILIINPLPIPVIGWNGSSFYTGTFSSYQWYKNGTLVAGATSNSYKPTSNGQYTVAVVSADGCKGTSIIYNLTNLAVSSISLSGDIKIYPNPTTENLIIEGANPGTLVSINTLVGQQVAAFTIKSKQEVLSLKSVSAGVYMLTISDGDGNRSSVRIVKL